LLLIVIAVLNSPVSAQSTQGIETLTFDAVVGPGNPNVPGLQIGPWLFASQQFHTVSLSDAGLLGFANNGTPYIASIGGGVDHPITLERLDGQPFSLVAFDAAEGFLDDIAAASEGYISATTVEVEATLATGFVVTLTYDLDGLRDGPDGANDFESFTAIDDLRNVTSVTFSGLTAARRDAGFALDNVVVAAVIPEPASAVTLLIALSVVGAVALPRLFRRSSANRCAPSD
jgi:hypothetical protein